jgi:hypothetical protein
MRCALGLLRLAPWSSFFSNAVESHRVNNGRHKLLPARDNLISDLAFSRASTPVRE